MNSFTSPMASPRHPLKISIPRVKNATPSRSITLTFRLWSSSMFSWKRLICPSRKSQSFPDGEVLIADGFSSTSSLTLVGSPTEEKCTSPKVSLTHSLSTHPLIYFTRWSVSRNHQRTFTPRNGSKHPNLQPRKLHCAPVLL